MAVIDFESRKRELETKRGINSTDLDLTEFDGEDWCDDGDVGMRGIEQEYNYVYELAMECDDKSSRTILVTGASTLWQLHYIIQQAFDWDNKALHRFALPEEMFKDITQDNAKIWGELCGIIFRYPDGDVEDFNWHASDYRRNHNLKFWYREKYSNLEEYGGEGDHYIVNQKEVEQFFHEVPYIKTSAGKKVQTSKATLAQLQSGVAFAGELNSLVTRLPLGEIFTLSEFVPKSKNWLQHMRGLVNGIKEMDGEEAAKELAMFERTISVGQQLLVKYCDEDGEFKDGVPKALQDELQREFTKATEAMEMRALLLEAFDPMVDGFTDKLVYHFGEKIVRVTCKNIYGAAFSEGGEMLGFADINENEVLPNLEKAVATVSQENKPICVTCDGVNVLGKPQCVL